VLISGSFRFHLNTKRSPQQQMVHCWVEWREMPRSQITCVRKLLSSAFAGKMLQECPNYYGYLIFEVLNKG
jgi:hypothetical protein